MVGTADAPADDGRDLQILFGLVLAITPRTSKSKDELPASRIHRQCNPRCIEVAFLSGPAIEFFAQEQFVALQDWYVASGQRLDPIDVTVQGQKGPVPGTFFLHTMDVRMYQADQRGYRCRTNPPVQIPPGIGYL